MKKILWIVGGVIAAVLVVLLIVASISPIHSGWVTEKRYTAAYTYITYQCLSRDVKTGACTYQMPVTNYMPASYRLDLKNAKGDTGWVYVDQHEYDTIKIGTQYGEEDQ